MTSDGTDKSATRPAAGTPRQLEIADRDLPDDAEDYVHRIGRTARAGASGDAISFACETYSFSLPDIEAYISHHIPMQPVSDELLANVDPKSRKWVDRAERLQPRAKSGGRGRSGGHSGPRGEAKSAGGEGQHRRRRKPSANA